MALQYGSCQISELLARRGKTQDHLAAHLDVTKGYISQVCSGQTRLSFINGVRTAKYLGVRVEDLYTWKDE